MAETKTIGNEELARRMAAAGGLSVSSALRLVGGLSAVLREVALRGESVRLLGFGRLETREGYRRVRNPRTGVISGNGRRRVYFKGVAL